jgi:exosortase
MDEAIRKGGGEIPGRDRRRNWTEWAMWLLVGGLLLYMYGVDGNNEQADTHGRSAVMWMVSRWRWSGADMSHGWLIPFVSAFVLWRKRKDWSLAAKDLSLAGLGVVVAALLLYVVGLRVQQTRLVLLSLIALLWGIPFFVYGRRIAGILLFPCAYLVFCIPMTFLEDLTLPLRLISTSVSSVLLNGLAIPVTRAGTAIHVETGGGFALDVGHPCSGLRYLTAMVAVTVVYAYFSHREPWKRVVLTLASVPLAMVGNIARIVLIAMVGTWFGVERAVGFYHDYSGYVVFAVAALLMVITGNSLDRVGKERKAGQQ